MQDFAGNIFLQNLEQGTSIAVSVDSDEHAANGASYLQDISANDRFVLFSSNATNLVAGDTNGATDLFIRDVVLGTTARISVATGGGQGNNGSYTALMSDDGRFVAFESLAGNLVSGDANGTADIFLRDTAAGTTTLVSVATSGGAANGQSNFTGMSADGRYVLFWSDASDLVAGDTNGVRDVFLRDTVLGTTALVSAAANGGPANGMAYDGGWSTNSMSADGRYIVFQSDASNLVAGDTNGHTDVFLRDTLTGTTIRLSVSSDGSQADGNSHDAVISPDGRTVTFLSEATNLVPGDTNNWTDTFKLSLIATQGADLLLGSAGTDLLEGFGGDDVLVGGAGADRLEGGNGLDTASYAASGAAVTVDLRPVTGIGTGGDAQGDTLTGIENLTGSAFDDTLYGNNGDNVLIGGAGNDRLYGNAGNDLFFAGAGADMMDGGVGRNTVTYAGGTVGVSVNLATGAASGGDAEGDQLIGISQVVGTSAADVLIGSVVINLLQGGAGKDFLQGGGGAADTLDGGAGVDTASYAGSSAAVAVSLTSGAGSGGDAQGDALTGIENLIGSGLNDYLYGDAGANTLAGGAGADYLDGRGGVDIADYSASSAGVNAALTGTSHGGDAEGDRLVAIEGIRGSAFADTLTGNAGANWLNGGAGSDTASYANSAAAVTANLATGTALGGFAQGDVLIGIENLDGSQYSDSLTGAAGANILQGLAGNDTLRGGAGADRLIGGAGIDTVSYTDGSAGVTVSLTSRAGSGGDAQGDYIDAENVNGSSFADALYGDAGANVLNGWAGRDILEGRGGADRFVFSAASHTAAGGNADRITDFSHAQGDRIDLSAIDARSIAAGDQAFHFIGSAGYSFTAGELHYSISGSTTIIGGDVNGDGISDFNIVLTGKVVLAAGDFVL